MKFKKITLENFRQFIGINQIEFTLDPERNITVVHAMNGVGKTTLLEAFRWCLYGEKLNLDNPQKILNTKLAVQGGVYNVGVTLEFIHDGIEYTLKRYHSDIFSNKGSYSLSPMRVVLEQTTGNEKTVSENERAQQIIEALFSKQLAQYFFYDGERIKTLGENRTAAGNDISAGLDSIMNVVYVKKVVNRLEKNVKKKLDESYDENAKEKLRELTKEAESKELKVAELQNEIFRINEIIERNDEKEQELDLAIVKHQELKDLQAQIIECDTEVKKNTKEIQAILSGIEIIGRTETKVRTTPYHMSVPSKTTAYVKTSLLEVMMNKVESKVETIQIVPENVQGLTYELLKRMETLGECVCGHEVSSDEIIALKNKLNESKDLESLQRDVEDFKKAIAVKREVLDTKKALSEFEVVKNRVVLLTEQNEKLHFKINELKKAQNSQHDVSSYQTEKATVRQETQLLNQKVGELTIRQQDLEVKLKQLTEQIEYIREAALSNVKTAKSLHAVQELITLGVNSIAKKKQKAEQVLVDSTIKCFNEMMHKNTKYIEVLPKKNYQYIVKTKIDDKQSALSEGERNIASLAFISGLISTAKAHYTNSKGNDLANSGMEVPLILDAPFAKLDGTHIKNVATIMPNLADQVILLTIDQQFMENAQTAIKHKIGKQYIMNNTTDHTVELKVMN